MNQEKKNKELCQSTFRKIHAPQELLGKVKNMNRESKIKKFTARKLTTVAAAMAIVLVSSNAIVYAASGSTWIEKVLFKVNGEERELDATITEYDNGEEQGKIIEVEVSEDEINNLEYSEIISGEEVGNNEEVGKDKLVGKDELAPGITVEEDKILLKVADVEIDITEDFADGQCSGEIEINGITYRYQVTGTSKEYSVSFEY